MSSIGLRSFSIEIPDPSGKVHPVDLWIVRGQDSRGDRPNVTVRPPEAYVILRDTPPPTRAEIIAAIHACAEDIEAFARQVHAAADQVPRWPGDEK